VTEHDFHAAYTVDFEKGLLFWKDPPPSHAEKRHRLAGFLCRGTGKNKDYWQVRCFGRTFKRGRVIFFMAHGRWPEPMLDHANGDSLDDRLANLRACTALQNTINRHMPAKKSGLPTGVYKTRQGRFMGRLGGKSLGTFETPDLALAIYMRARKEAYGEFA
jgi:hypothetical protein